MSLVRSASAKNWTKEACFDPSDDIPLHVSSFFVRLGKIFRKDRFSILLTTVHSRLLRFMIATDILFHGIEFGKDSKKI